MIFFVSLCVLKLKVMKKFVVVYQDGDHYSKWLDADIDTEFSSYEDACVYINNVVPVGVPLDIKCIEV